MHSASAMKRNSMKSSERANHNVRNEPGKAAEQRDESQLSQPRPRTSQVDSLDVTIRLLIILSRAGIVVQNRYKIYSSNRDD
jgi:hypothetical protein